MTMSLDGFTSGPNQTLEKPFGDHCEHFNDWLFALAAVAPMFGKSGGETGPSNDVFVERMSNVGAFIMGRHMFGGGTGAWPTDPVWNGWWGANPPYHAPVFVLTHHARASLPMEGGTTFHFVTDGPAAALERAREAAGTKDIAIAGGATTVRQYLALGAIEELELHLVPQLLGAGERLFEGATPSTFTQIRCVPGTGVTHLRYRLG